jgi:hypothetical protein
MGIAKAWPAVSLDFLKRTLKLAAVITRWAVRHRLLRPMT